MNKPIFTAPVSGISATTRWPAQLRMILFTLMLLSGAVLAGGAAADEAPAHININTAAAEQLSDALTGVGLAKARLIVAYREMHGPFEHVDELAEVRGIGISTVEKNRERIVLH